MKNLGNKLTGQNKIRKGKLDKETNNIEKENAMKLTTKNSR